MSTERCANGYRFLNPDEIIKEGDEIIGSYIIDWTPLKRSASAVGLKRSYYSQGPFNFRRKVDIDAGYRLLNVGEILQEGDEYFSPSVLAWYESSGGYTGDICKVGDSGYNELTYRRKVEAKTVPTPKFSNDQRVQTCDKHSRFNGVTGKTTARITLPLPIRYFVQYNTPQEKEQYKGGWYLESELKNYLPEETPPIDSKYHILGPDDIIQKGDEWSCDIHNFEDWDTYNMKYNYGKKVKDILTYKRFKFRRPIKEEPQYRFLKYDELILNTDEQIIDYVNDKPVWGKVPSGYHEEHWYVGKFDAKVCKFRRKVN